MQIKHAADIYPLIEATMAHLSEGIVIAKDNGEIIYSNPAAEALLALPSPPAHMRELRQKGLNVSKRALKAAIEEGEVDAAGRPSGRFIRFHDVIPTPRGERWLEVQTGLVKCNLDKLPLRVLILSDHTSERRLDAFFKQDDPEKFVTHDLEMIHLLERIEQVAPVNVPVLLEGESGTGKTRLARMIHSKSPRAGMPFVEVNCAAVPETLLETEFFGHMKGSFTGAHKDREGRFKAADGGTLFLDEIGEIPLTLQPKLLRALQDQLFEPVGSNKSIHVDIRIIAASNKDLKQMVQEGAFRADLYYRIAVIPLCVPPLRDRPSDIRLLIDYFIEQCSLRLALPKPAITPEALRLFMDYPWPGNVRELANAIEHGVICAIDERIEIDSLPFDIRRHEGRIKRATSGEDIDKNLILTTLEAMNWNRSKAAQSLGIDRSTLWRWMQRLNIEPPR